MKTIEELEALLEAVTRERDKLSVLVELSDGYRRERDEARAELAFIRAEYANARNEELTEDALALKIAALVQERDEARADVDMLEDRLSESRAEVQRFTDERDELLVRVADQDAELRATREAYRDAYRRLCAPMWEEP